MIIDCMQCGHMYDDADQQDLCPHKPYDFCEDSPFLTVTNCGYVFLGLCVLFVGGVFALVIWISVTHGAK